MTIYDHVNKLGIPLSEVFFLWSCFFIHRIVPCERVLMHVNYGSLSRSACGIRVIHMALRWGSSKLVVRCTDIWASLKCRNTIEVSSRRTWSLRLVYSLFSKTFVLFAGLERPDWYSPFKTDLQTPTFDSALLKYLACNVNLEEIFLSTFYYSKLIHTIIKS
jgi:hypothetical protein